MPEAEARLIVFDDAKADLSPMTDLRAAFDIRTGALTNLERLEREIGRAPDAVIVPEAIEAVVRDRFAGSRTLVNELPVGASDYLLINARWVVPSEQIDDLETGDQLIEGTTEHLVAMRGTLEDARAILRGQTPSGTAIDRLDAPTLLARPWQFKTFRDAALDVDLHLLAKGPTQELPPGVMQIGDHTLTIHPEAIVYPSVVLDLEHGPIVISKGAVIRPGAILSGPLFIGEGSTVLDRSIVKAHTALGPRCKVAGEVGGCIFQAFSNKAHDGHLGDSWIGEWVNLGAGTTNSNLLNTYSEVPVLLKPDGSRERTGETFLGCILGDHVKTAISTRIMTGAVALTGVMHAASAPIDGCLPPFAWCTDSGRRHYRFERFMDVARTAMARRKIEPGQAYVNRLAELQKAAARYFG